MRAEVLVAPGFDAYVRVRFTAGLPDDEWLARPRAFLTRRPDGDYLEFEPAADYLGREVKRRPYRADELVRVPAGGSVESDQVDLRSLYELPDVGAVRLRYAGYHPLAGPGHGGGPFEPVVSDWVTLELRATVGPQA
jgi:hypothetical protein